MMTIQFKNGRTWLEITAELAKKIHNLILQGGTGIKAIYDPHGDLELLINLDEILFICKSTE